MQVPTKKLNNWLRNLDPGDRGKLVKFTGTSLPTVSKALKGEAKQTLIVMIDKFFDNKFQSISK